ncbi:DUF6941 family protein [Candidatus Palauibacter sp.]|uniref:DUF6941 family protein n=1 Tax=Candidatus Palauibacter sp. TaxID=3101350 RepID=UPI003AF24C8E
MQVALAVLADLAIRSEDGKLSVIGLFDGIRVGNLPAKHSQLSLVLRMTAESSETGREHPIQIRCMDADGESLLTINGEVTPQPPPHPDLPATVDQIINIKGMRFEKYGGYSFSIFIDSDLKKTVQLQVVELDTT